MCHAGLPQQKEGGDCCVLPWACLLGKDLAEVSFLAAQHCTLCPGARHGAAANLRLAQQQSRRKALVSLQSFPKDNSAKGLVVQCCGIQKHAGTCLAPSRCADSATLIPARSRMLCITGEACAVVAAQARSAGDPGIHPRDSAKGVSGERGCPPGQPTCRGG